jgi:hypothetical protein
MSFVKIVQALGLLECCGDKRPGKPFERCRSPSGVVPADQDCVGGVGINFRADKTGALVVLSLIPQGNMGYSAVKEILSVSHSGY